MKWSDKHGFVLNELESITSTIKETEIDGLFGTEKGFMAIKQKNGLRTSIEIDSNVISDLLKRGFVRCDNGRVLITHKGVNKLSH